MIRTVVNEHGREVRVELRRERTYGSKTYDWQAWFWLVIPDAEGSASGGPRLVRAGDREFLIGWVKELTPTELFDLAKPKTTNDG